MKIGEASDNEALERGLISMIHEKCPHCGSSAAEGHGFGTNTSGETVCINCQKPVHEPPAAPQPPKPNWKKEVAKAVLIGGGSVAAGMAAGHGLTRLAPGFFMNKGNPQTANLRGSAVKVILPILAASAVMMGERFRHKMDEKYKSAPGWGEEPKK